MHVYACMYVCVRMCMPLRVSTYGRQSEKEEGECIRKTETCIHKQEWGWGWGGGDNNGMIPKISYLLIFF